LSVVVTSCREGLLLKVRVTAKSQCDGLPGVYHAADGAAALSVRVRAAPEQGRANRAVIETMAIAFGVAKSTISIRAGESGRNKTVLIAGDPDRLVDVIAPQLKSLLKEHK
jgi:uncharacterized protein (TIGR00251 family)